MKQNFGVLISLLQSWGILLTLGAISFFLISAGMEGSTMLSWIGRWMKKTAEQYYCQG